MNEIDFAKEKLLNDIVELERSKEQHKIDPNRFKLKLSGILSTYEIKNDNHNTYESDLEEKIAFYLSGKQIEGLSPTTLSDYKIELRLFAKSIHKLTKDITSSDIRLYLSRFDTLKMSTIGKKLFVLKSFFSWLHNEEIIARNPAAKIKQPKEEKLLINALNIEELEMVRESCKTLRERALVECLYATGARLSEIIKLDKQNINYQSMSTTVYGKGSKERTVYFSFKAVYHLKQYINSRKDDDPALFVSYRHPHKRLSHRAVEREIHLLGKRANIDRSLTPHVFRRTLSTLLLAQGAELAGVQAILGHSSPETTLRYAKVTDNYKREQYKKYLVQ